MEKEHDVLIQSENHTFQSNDEFLCWKEKMEADQHVYFSKQFGKRRRTEADLYYCQQDGSSKPHKKKSEVAPKTSRKNKKGRAKNDQICFALLKVQTKDDMVYVNYITTHSHPISAKDIQHHPIPPSEREKIKTKLSVGIPVEIIYKHLREGHGSRDERDEEFHVKKTHFKNKRQITEMSRKMKINRRLHQDDASSVCLIVQQLRKEKYNGVIMYKPRNESIVVH